MGRNAHRKEICLPPLQAILFTSSPSSELQMCRYYLRLLRLLAQVKTTTVGDISKVPSSILGAAWGRQRERMKAGIYFPLFLVLRNESKSAVYYLPTEFQTPRIFKKRAPLSATARRAGWQGFSYDLSSIGKAAVVRILPSTPDDKRAGSRRRRSNHAG